jgi:competence ComEA-like helix-hairpin-helix protein
MPVTPFERLKRYLSNGRHVLFVASTIVAVISAGIWLYRDIRDVVEEFGHDEGSLSVNINTATQEELESVPGIGPTRAAQIIAGRPYKTVDEIARINGIGQSQVEGLRPFLKTEGNTEKR